MKNYIRIVAGVLALEGLAMLFTASGNERLQQQRDVLSGLSHETMLVAGGLLHLILSGCLLVLENSMSKGFLAFWMGLNYIVFHAAMSWARVIAPFPTMRLIAWKIGIKPDILNCCWNLFTGFLVIGGALYLMLEWRISERLQNDAYLKDWSKKRERNEGGSTVMGHH